MSGKLKRELRKLLAAAVIFAAVMVFTKLSGVSDRRITFALFLIPYLICGLPVLKKAALGIVHGQMFDESFLMAIASAGAFITGESEEAAAVMLFYQIGEWFQSFAVGRSRQSITELMNIVPEYANLENEDGTTEQVDPDDVNPGDILVILPGEKIPVDAEVLSGESFINTSALTGEPVPRSAGPGDAVISGCVNGDGMLRVKALKAYEDSTVSRILELVESASEKKSKTENFITRFARYYTPIVVFAAIALAVIPAVITGNPMVWIYRACTFLVISCPCALVISVPLAFFGGIGAASRNGVLVKGSNYLELLSGIDTVVSDKTGTLTEGCFEVTAVRPAAGVSMEELLRAAAEAESFSTHPIAGAVRRKYEEACGQSGTFNVYKAENYPGLGIAAWTDGGKVLAGNAKLLRENGIEAAAAEDPGATVCHIALDGKYLGALMISDRVKEGAAQAIAELKKCGTKRVVMLTGDRKGAADAVAAELGIDEVCPELLPQDKVEAAERMIGSPEYGRVAFVGDGINDAPVLTRADVGIAMGSLGSDAAIEAADVVIMDDDLRHLPRVVRIARRTIAISKQNIVFALAVKLLILILGAFGIANMWAAVFADVGVAVLCILNSMRLLAVSRRPEYHS